VRVWLCVCLRLFWTVVRDIFGVNYFTFLVSRQASLDLIMFPYTKCLQRWFHTFSIIVGLFIAVQTMHLIYWNTVLEHEHSPYFEMYPAWIYKCIEHSESLRDEFREGTLKLAIGTSCKTITHYIDYYLLITFQAILLCGWISVVNNTRINIVVRLPYQWLCFIKPYVKNRTSDLHRIMAE
jgi:hypothetical protein